MRCLPVNSRAGTKSRKFSLRTYGVAQSLASSLSILVVARLCPCVSAIRSCQARMLPTFCAVSALGHRLSITCRFRAQPCSCTGLIDVDIGQGQPLSRDYLAGAAGRLIGIPENLVAGLADFVQRAAQIGDCRQVALVGCIYQLQ